MIEIEIKSRIASPSIGAQAFPSPTPTLASAHRRVAILTTRNLPDSALLRYSVADSVAAHAPVLEREDRRLCGARQSRFGNGLAGMPPTGIEPVHAV